MRRTLEDGYELDDDPTRVDVDAVHAYLTGSYWAMGRTRGTVERLIRDATRVVGLYSDGATVGFCRILSDDTTMAHLFDVYVLPGHRGHGLGVELVREAVERGPHADLSWHLGTKDAHGLYERFEFGPPDLERQMLRRGQPRP